MFGISTHLCLSERLDRDHLVEIAAHGFEAVEVFAVRDSPKPPSARLTMSLPVLHRAGLRVVLALGAEKGRVAARARGPADPGLPVSLLPRHDTVWYLDDPAVAAYRAATG